MHRKFLEESEKKLTAIASGIRGKKSYFNIYTLLFYLSLYYVKELHFQLVTIEIATEFTRFS